MHPEYRRDIDGLRALAVSLVVLFHAFPDTLPGGFVGVDVFFVISGFLISSIIIRGLEQGSFSFRDFYARRIRRIFPALVFVLLANVVAGWFLLFADEYRRLGRHVMGGVAFTSNFVLWSESGYFDSAADTKPLLHLWSLAIEEQFYLLYPFFLWMLFRKGISRIPILAVVAMASFGLSVVLLVQEYESMSFYWPISRLWELLIGGLVACLAGNFRQRPVLIHNVSALVGLALLMTSVVTLDRASAFPGWNAGVPVVGTCLLICSLQSASFVNRLFQNPAVVAIGLISYPLYLWHWSLLSFGRILGYTTVWVRIFLIVVSLVLAALTYWFIERRVRARKSRVFTTPILVLTLAVLGVLGVIVQQSNGFPSRAANRRFGTNLEQLKTAINQPSLFSCPSDFKPQIGLNYCAMSRSGVPEFALIGDSHAQDKFPGLAAADPGRSWLLLAHNSCPPVLGIEVKGDHPYCEERARDAIKYISGVGGIKTVVLTFFGAYMLQEPFAADHRNADKGPQTTTIRSDQFPNATKEELFEKGLEQAIRELERAGKRVVLMLDGPELPFFPRDCLRLGWENAACRITRKAVLSRQSILRGIVANLQARHPEMRVFDSVNIFCKDELCEIHKDGQLLFSDSHHLSEFGSRYFAQAFISWLRRG